MICKCDFFLGVGEEEKTLDEFQVIESCIPWTFCVVTGV